MKLIAREITAGKARLVIEGGAGQIVNVSGEAASEVALRIARAFNRDKHFDALVAALTPFRSGELGGGLVHMIDMRENGGEAAQGQLVRLIAMIDVILDAVEAIEDVV